MTSTVADMWDRVSSLTRQSQRPALPPTEASDKLAQARDEPLVPLPVIEAAATPQATSETAAGTAGVGTAYTAPVEPRGDPREMALRRRAEAAGLHRDLSLALLERLSTADFKNAAAAVEKALAEVDDNAVLVWPRQRLPNEALFVIHFVTGAASDCRRYVVSIDKDRWSTTAPAMETCGVRRRK